MPKTLADLIRWSARQVEANPAIANYQLFIEGEEAVDFELDNEGEQIIILVSLPEELVNWAPDELDDE